MSPFRGQDPSSEPTARGFFLDAPDSQIPYPRLTLNKYLTFYNGFHYAQVKIQNL